MSQTSAAATQHELQVRRRKIAGVLKGEPWVYPNAVIDGPATAGLVRVVDDGGKHVGWADWNPDAPVRARMLSRATEWQGDLTLIHQRIEAAFNRRLRCGYSLQGSAMRLVNGEGDGLPGLAIDLFGTSLVCDFYSLGMWRRREHIEAMLTHAFSDYSRYFRVGAEAAKRENMQAVEPEEGMLEYGENGLLFEVTIGSDQKSGAYLDQRDNRRLVAHWASGRRVLDLFCYHANFALCCLGAGASEAVAIDSSELALMAAQANADRNGFPLEVRQANVFDALDDLAGEEHFDLVICDPPKLAPRRRDKARALGAYRFLIDRCLRLLEPGGILLVSSCSQAIGTDDLREIIAQIGSKKRLALDVLAETTQPSDHPWPVGFLAGRYLASVAVELRGEA